MVIETSGDNRPYQAGIINRHDPRPVPLRPRTKDIFWLVGATTHDFRGWFFCLAFVSIGLATNFRDLTKHLTGGKPLILYVCGQTFNLALTLLVAYIMFYLVFPDITAKI